MHILYTHNSLYTNEIITAKQSIINSYYNNLTILHNLY